MTRGPLPAGWVLRPRAPAPDGTYRKAPPREPVPDEARERARVRRRLEELAEDRELREATDWPSGD